MTLTDGDLVLQFNAGNNEAFNALLKRYEIKLNRYVNKIVKHDQDTQDLTQDIWLQVYEHLNELRSPEHFGVWLFTIAKNRCRYHLGQKGKIIQTPLDGQELVDPNEEHVRQAQRRQVKRALSSLSTMLRKTVTLYYLTEYTTGEVSSSLNVPVGTVKRRLSDARKKLKSLFNDIYRQSGSETPWLLTL